MKLLRTLRLDPSDGFVFDRAAESGEWAVPGSVLFAGFDLDDATPKMRAAFRAGFLGLTSFGFSTLVEVAEIEDAERHALFRSFSAALLEGFGAPSPEAAKEAARDEIAFAASLCDHEPGTVIAMHRILEGGAIREQFRTLHRREATPGADRRHTFARAFEFIEVEEPEERVDLTGLLDRR
jgi:hypothetical protein